jgi:2-haloacid dehalogenase
MDAPVKSRTWERRRFLGAGAGFAAGLTLPARAAERARFTAVAFDAFPIFDPQSVATRAESLFPGKGAELTGAWRMRQFEYTWLRSLSGRYADFMRVTEDALVFAARAGKLDLTDDKRGQLLAAWSDFAAWPDVVPALRRLRQNGVSLAFLSNFTPGMLQGCIRTAGIDSLFDHVLSTDAARTYKPDPRAYQLGVEAFKRRKEDILFVAFAGWDAAGAKAFGYPTFWMNRPGLPAEELGARPDASGANFTDLLEFLGL